jgi:hypothetical protein
VSESEAEAMDAAERLSRVRDDLYLCMESGEVQPRGKEALQLATDLVIHAFPEAPRPTRLDDFTLLVGSAFGAAVQRLEMEN